MASETETRSVTKAQEMMGDSMESEPRGAGRTSRMLQSLMAAITYVVPKHIYVMCPNLEQARDALAVVATQAEERNLRIDQSKKSKGTLTICGCRVDFGYPGKTTIGLRPDFYLVDHWAFEHWREMQRESSKTEHKPRPNDVMYRGESEPIKPGDVVMLKSGGPKMTAGDVDTLGTITLRRCAWFVDEKITSEFFPDYALVKVAP